MSYYSEIERGASGCELDAADDIGLPATEQHSATSSNHILGRAKLLQAIRKFLWLMLKSASLIFFSARGMARDGLDNMRKTNPISITESLYAPCPNDKNEDRAHWQREEYNRVFHTKIMSLESMQLPKNLIELYKKVHNPETVAFIDRTVCQMLQHRESARALKSVLRATAGPLNHSSDGIWKQRLKQHQAIIELNMTQLVDTLSKTKEDTLVEMVDATAQSAAEMQSRQALIDLNKSMLCASQTVIPIHKETENVQQPQKWTLSLSEEDIDQHRATIARQTTSQLAC